MMRLFKSDSKYSDAFLQFELAGASGSGGSGGSGGSDRCGDDGRVPTIRRTRMRMAMAIVSCVIYCDMSPGNLCHCGTNYLTKKYVGPTLSLGIVAGKPGSEGLAESKASTSNLRRIQVKDIVKEVEDYLKTYSSAEMDIRWYVKGIRCSFRESQRWQYYDYPITL
nr:hypothetical protein [Tanacetum cinerariifolium]